MTIESAALSYLEKGFSIIPLQPAGKEPLFPWKEFQKRKASPEEVKSWFQKWPNANVGIVTGSVSGVIVVDLDGQIGIQQAHSLNLVSPVVSTTGRGKHLWYSTPTIAFSVGNSVRIYPGIDVRGEGGYAVASPSIHPSGLRYRWIGSGVNNVVLLPILPGIFWEPVKGVVTKPVAKEIDWVAKALEEMKDGNIDDTLFKICAKLRNAGFSEADACGLLSPHADRVDATDGHLGDKIKNVWGRYESKRDVQFSPSASGSLQLHTPSSTDSIKEFNFRIQDELAGREGGNSLTRMGTGYPKFDTLSKGLKKGEVLTVAARTGIGKTNWIITPIRTFCEAGKKVLLFSTEMSFDQIWQRYRATLKDTESFRNHQFYICDEFTPNIERIEEAIRNVSPDLFVFDHISHIGTDYHIISKFMSEIKRIVRLFNIPAIVTAQLNRNADWVENGERIAPRMSMIQGSGAIEQMSAQVLLLAEKRVNGGCVEIDGVLDKNRHGDKGLIKFGLLKNPYRIEEI